MNSRWDEIMSGMVERKRKIENEMLRIGKLKNDIEELLIWIDKKDGKIDEIKNVDGDKKVIEVEIEKMKVMVNDIKENKKSVDKINDEGRKIIE